VSVPYPNDDVPGTGDSFIHNLCVSLYHRWKPGYIFVLLTAYLDEAGTHGGDGTAKNPASPTTVMAGMMGTANQWRRFEREFDKIRRRYGFKVLHTLDFKRARGEFRGWMPEKQASLLADLLPLIDALMEGALFRIDNDTFRADYIGKEKIRKPQLDTVYGFCFRNCVLHFLLEAERRLGSSKQWGDTRINFVLDRHKNNGDAIRILDEMRTGFADDGNYTIEYISVGNKDICPPLAVSDFLAHTVWSMDQEKRATGLPDEVFFGNSTRGKSNLAHITYTPDGLVNVKARLTERVKKGGTLK
jgi:Protein of unknown function (DUF3800)